MTPDKISLGIQGYETKVYGDKSPTITITYIVRLAPKYVTKEIVNKILGHLEELAKQEVVITPIDTD